MILALHIAALFIASKYFRPIVAVFVLRYEGDFRSDLMDGKGVYVWQDGT